MIPVHKAYIEPFFGAGWVYFYKEKSKLEVINDIDHELINMFRMIKEHAPEINRIMKYEINSRTSFEYWRDCKVDELTEINRAIRYLYTVNYSFGSKAGTYGYSKVSPPGKKAMDTELVMAVKERLINTYVESHDYKTIISKYDHDHSFFFLDPPYIDTSISFNVNCKIDFNRTDFIEMQQILKNIKGKFLLTINDCKFIRDLFYDFFIIEVDVPYSIKKDTVTTYKELIITNY